MNTRRRILVVDDAAMFRELESLCLSRAGRVITAQDGVEALGIARRERPQVIVTDLDMPGLDGAQLCQQIRADSVLADTPVLIVTSGEDPEDRARAVRAGADDVLSKPIHRLLLIEAVNRLLTAPMVRGLSRVALRASAHIRSSRADVPGTVRNLSRGGVYLESDRDFPVESEVTLEVHLPDSPGPLTPTAKVVWQRRATGGRPYGLGLQFLALERGDTRRIEDFLHEHADAMIPARLPATLSASR